MSQINIGRVILGGLLAGLVIDVGEFILNGLILGRQWEEAMRALNRPPVSSQAVTTFVILGFVLGLIIIWLYAAIRPRFGAGPKTAIYAGLAGWALAFFYSTVGQMPLDLFPTKVLLIALVWGLFELPIASVVGAWLYKE